MLSRENSQTVIFLFLGALNILLYLLVFVAAILKAKDGKLAEIIQSVYCMLISIFLAMNEFKTFNFSDVYLGFLGLHVGKGLVMLFLGCAVMCENAYNIIVAILGFTIGLGYIIVSFVPLAPLPADLHTLWKIRRRPEDISDLPCQFYTPKKADPFPLIQHPSFLPATTVHPMHLSPHY
ncbi:hypothetical protein DM01DRAFT_1187516 [Hesseltinella vesiculosa]|uniref:COPI associated n=1 Tax=Hesseltinella vesiculosa TaxID=101127 RepID=A0A1X2GR18_9FUNG|nr:hypothetical protein DM01DRAFT_1187516 [Hesseltinella vesiculosa]